ncbi:MAG: acyl-CoA dehydrogenase family protein [Spirochaetes bacterium]|nr:acyl-CoA dehydrogenase family protein [Spirochaetota bacterium]
MTNVKRLPRSIPFTAEHNEFRKMAASFFQKECVPRIAEWEAAGEVTRDIWEKAGSLGMICPTFPEAYGGLGVDFLYSVIMSEEQARADLSGIGFPLHSDVVAPYILNFANDEQKKRWLPGVIAGTKILAIAMTEPGTGSDLAAVTTRAEDKGDYYLLNGSKTFISNGYLSDLCIVVARTGAGASGVSLLVAERGMPGFERGRKLKKIGMHSQDTAELHFSDVKIPKANLLGRPNAGFRYLMHGLAQERLIVAIANMISAERILDETVKYCNERRAFGKPIGAFQNTRFKLVDMYVEQEAARSYLDRVIMLHAAGEKTTCEASAAKLQCSELLQAHASKCLQFFGGYGFMTEYPIAKAYMDSRVQTIYAGTSEIMREIVSKNLGLAAT